MYLWHVRNEYIAKQVLLDFIFDEIHLVPLRGKDVLVKCEWLLMFQTNFPAEPNIYRRDVVAIVRWPETVNTQ